MTEEFRSPCINQAEPGLFSTLHNLFIDITELLADLLKKQPKETDGIDSVVVVDNVPKVGSERMEKLQNVLRKIFGKFGKIQTEHMPMDDGKTKGYILFVIVKSFMNR